MKDIEHVPIFCMSQFKIQSLPRVRFNVNGGILSPQTISDWKNDGNSHPIEHEQIEQILFAEGD